MSMMKVRVGDRVRVIAGKDRDKEGKIKQIDHKKAKVLVEGVNMITKHEKPNRNNQEGGIVKRENFLDASNVMLVHDGKPTRVGFKFVDGKKVRYAKTTGKVID